MSLELKSQLGNVDVSNDVIANLTGGLVSQCPGVVGMASRQQLKDGFTELVKKDNYSRGIVVRFDESDTLSIDVYIIVSYGSRISEVAHQIQSEVRQGIQSMLGVLVETINVFVQGVSVEND
ncbi:Asp23/Gls24 family envelope stress response protein [Terrilactibacillus sp. BCM23-1]|uniref:Asp23/Gls24 family envelope stress response protein n=1 Tax=Terrilactibacillus tamarindi TaxID=2599694 RepID=A0A6N8CQA5_9BACI|nr:Asp23/Gls24 family envelope stress response protein [Terrilactibacillus tamarindi]MTT32312.1 Asp23/Gls24 family envelope stress response protein [Terrilactibacillus tamarindi]